MRMPTLFLPHGGGPWPFVELGLPRAELEGLAGWLKQLPGRLPASPRALLVISAHWEGPQARVQSGAQPPLLFDYYGFPESAYALRWDAPGDPGLAARVVALLAEAGIPCRPDAERGFDHGTFVPLKVAWPAAAVPTVQLSLLDSLDPGAHLALGRALAPLRDEGVLIVGSGMSFHNLPAFFGRLPLDPALATAFDAWLGGLFLASPPDREAALLDWAQAPGARACHPREEHLLPLHVVAGAGGADDAQVLFRGTFAGWPILAAGWGAWRAA